MSSANSKSPKSSPASFSNFVKLFVLGGVALFAFKVVNLARHVLMLTHPEKFYPDPYAKYMDFSKNCSEVSFQEVRTFVGVHSIQEAVRITKLYPWEPILFKRFIKNPTEEWNRIEAHHHHINISVHDLKMYGFGNLCFAGGQPEQESVTTTLDGVINSPFVNGRAMYGSFVTFLDPDFEEDAELKSFDQHVNVVKDTSFLSNFPHDVLASPVHFATGVDSYSIQYVGRKLWLMVPPHIMEEIGMLSTPSSFPLGGSELELFKLLNGVMQVTIQEEGDLFFFPPQYGHAVITKAGKNVMVNYREFAPLKAAKTNLFRMIESGISSMLSKTKSTFSHHGEKIKNDQMRLNYQRSHRIEGENIDSGCAPIWKEMLNRPSRYEGL